MKTLAAWSQGRLDEFHHQQRIVDERLQHSEQCFADISAISETLIRTLPLYDLAIEQAKKRAQIGDWVKEQSDIVKNSVDRQVSRVRLSLMKAVTDAIGPLVKEVIEKKAVDDFCALVELDISRSLFEHSSIEVPTRLHSVFVEEMQRRGLNLQINDSDRSEISVSYGDTKIETRIEPAIERLERILQQ